MIVYCYELVPTRGNVWTRAMDDWLRENYFPGLSIAQVSEDFRGKFKIHGHITDWMIRKHLCEMKLCSLRKNPMIGRLT
jgi:hypothetical protein